MVEMDMFNMFNVQRAITPKVGKPELRFMCSSHCLVVLYICVKFGENIRLYQSYGADTMEVLTGGRTGVRTYGHLLGITV